MEHINNLGTPSKVENTVCISGVCACLSQIPFQKGVVAEVTQCPESCYHWSDDPADQMIP